MPTLTFDALGFCKALQLGGFSREQAETLTEQQQKVMDDMLNSQELATKGDLRETELRLQTEIEKVRGGMQEIKISLIKWFVGGMLTLGAFLAAIIFGVFAVLPQLAGFVRG